MLDVYFDRDAAAHAEVADHFQPFRVHGFDQIVEHAVGDSFMKAADIAEREEIELKSFRLYTAQIGSVVNLDMRKIRLAGNRTKRCELGAVQADNIVAARSRIVEGVENGFVRVVRIFGGFAEKFQVQVSHFDSFQTDRSGPLRADWTSGSNYDLHYTPGTGLHKPLQTETAQICGLP